MTKGSIKPYKELDWRLLNSILQFGARLIDCSDMLELSEDTIQRRINDKYDMTFREYRKLKMSKTRIKLLQKQLDVAFSGNVTMLIFLGKQYLDQSDKIDTRSQVLIDDKSNKDSKEIIIEIESIKKSLEIKE